MRTLKGTERFPLLSGGDGATLNEVNAFVRSKADVIPTPIVLMRAVALTNAQLLHLHSAPVTIIPAPGVGKAIIVLSSIYITDGGDPFTQFLNDIGPSLFYAPLSSGFGNQADLANLSLAADGLYQAPPITTNTDGRPGGQNILPFVDNAAVILANLGGNLTDGLDRVARITVLYYVVSTSQT